jgi:hypothetical protein
MSNAKFKTTETRPNTNKDQFIESGETRSMNDSQTTYSNAKKSEKGEITQNLAQTDADMNRIIITIDDGVEVQQSTNINANVSEENVKTAQYKYVKNTDDDIRTYADVVKNVKTSPTLPTPQTGTEKRQLMMQDPITKKWSRIEKSVMQVDTKTLQEHEIARSTQVYDLEQDKSGNKIETVLTNNREAKSRSHRPHKPKQNTYYGSLEGHQKNSIYHSQSENIFKGQYTGRVKRYYIGGIHSKSTESGLEEYLTERGVNPVELSLFESKRGNLCAKVTIPHYEDYIIQDVNFWPRFMRCRQWMSKNAWQQRRNDYYQDDYNDYNNVNYREETYVDVE